MQANESDFKVLVVTEDSSLVLNQLRVDEQGTYRCSLQDRNGALFYQVRFLLSGKKNSSKKFKIKIHVQMVKGLEIQYVNLKQVWLGPTL